MTPIRRVRSALRSFHPNALPPMVRASYGREMAAWWFLSMMLGAIEGGVMSVIVKKGYAGVGGISPSQLNFAVAAVAAAPSLANITSFMWASITHGKSKIKFITWLQFLTALFIASIALSPRTLGGLALLTLSTYAARICWTGVILIRTAVWRQNYPRIARATIAGKLASIQAVVMAMVGVIMGWSLDLNSASFHIVFPLAALGGAVGTAIYARVRMRGQKRLARAERSGVGVDQPSLNPLSVIRVLNNDPHYRRFMMTMFVFGLGNLMIDAPLAIILQEQFHLGYWPSILITSSVSDVLMPVAIPIWARLLNRWHVVQFRAIHAWSYVLAAMLSLTACVTHQAWLMFVMAVVKGLADAGGALAWNLGHHDFAKDHNASQYMGVHVTLQGIRGLMAPFLGVGIYQLFEHWRPGFGVWAFAPCLALNMSGAAGFGLMWRELRHKLRPHSREGTASSPGPLKTAVAPRDA